MHTREPNGSLQIQHKPPCYAHRVENSSFASSLIFLIRLHLSRLLQNRQIRPPTRPSRLVALHP